MSFISCAKSAADDAAVLQEAKDYADQAAAAAAVATATEAAQGKVELATVTEISSGAGGALAINPANLVSALNDAAGPNALQGAVTNAIEQGIGSDAGATGAIADALAADADATATLAAALGGSLADSIKADTPTTAAAVSTSKFVTPGGLAAALTDTATPDGNAMQKAVTAAVGEAIGGDAATQQAIADAIGDEVANSAAVQAAIAAASTPDATDTVKGKVSLAVAANAPSTSDTEAATPAFVNAAIAAAAPSAQDIVDDIASDATAQSTLAGALADDLGATAAETIAGTVSDKFISPDDLKATLGSGAAYQLAVSASYGTTVPVLATIPSGLNGGTEGGYNAVYGRSLDPGTYGAGVYGAKVASSNAVFFGGLGYEVGPVRAAVYGAQSGVDAAGWAGYFEGNVFYSGSLTSSDKRLKDNFGDAPSLATVEIKAFDKYSVTKDADGKEVRTFIGRQAGVVAQDVQAVAPELVSEAGGYLAVQESSILFAMIAELRAEIAALKAK